MLQAMTDDLEALELLRADIRRLFPPGPVRDRWLAWASGLLEPESGARMEPSEETAAE
jgi:hypothetical protein